MREKGFFVPISLLKTSYPQIDDEGRRTKRPTTGNSNYRLTEAYDALNFCRNAAIMTGKACREISAWSSGTWPHKCVKIQRRE